MDFWFSTLLSLFMFAFAAGMMLLHVRTWRTIREQDPDPVERDYRRRQFRRRMQTSAMLGLLGVAILIGQLVTAPPARPLAFAIFCMVVLLLVVWVCMLAVADVIATKHHFGRLRQTYLVEQAKLKGELVRLQGKRRNGTPQDK